MAKIKVISTGSIGNSYILECEDGILLIELGVSWDKIIKSLNYQEGFRKVRGCITSHIHKDHIQPNTLKKALSRGVRVFGCREVCDEYNGVHYIAPKSIFNIGNFTIQSLPLKHNAECYGYIIRHPEFGKLVFATDCYEFRYRIRDVNHMLIECNYDENHVLDNAMSGYFSQSASENHMELKECIDALTANYNPALENVVLIHMSTSNCDSRVALNAVRDSIPVVNIDVAKAGNTYELKKEDF